MAQPGWSITSTRNIIPLTEVCKYSIHARMRAQATSWNAVGFQWNYIKEILCFFANENCLWTDLNSYAPHTHNVNMSINVHAYTLSHTHRCTYSHKIYSTTYVHTYTHSRHRYYLEWTYVYVYIHSLIHWPYSDSLP